MRTAPIDIECSPDRVPLRPWHMSLVPHRYALPQTTTRRLCARVAGPGSAQEDQPELSDLNLVTAAQRGGVDRFPVDIGAVEAAHVDHLELVVSQPELGMPTAHGDVVEEDVAVGVPSRRRGRLVEQESRPALGPRLTTSSAVPGEALDRGVRGFAGRTRMRVEFL